MHDPGRGPEEGQSQKGEEVRTHVTTQSSVVAAMASRRWRRVDGVGGSTECAQKLSEEYRPRG